jgi:glutamate racemase
MMQPEAHQPIGLFDSGVGGLTVAHSIQSLLPREKIIYFGDTFHLPYGDKSSESVRYYACRISDFLLEKNCKTVLIACNTASSTAYDEVVDHVAGRAIVLNVVDPVVSLVSRKHADGKVGVIGTKGTINSQTYETKIHRQNNTLEVISMATPLFVPMIEEGFIYDDISNAIIRAYLSDKRFSGIHTLILGCTHYPIIKRQIEKFFNFGVDVIDAANIVAHELKTTLEEMELMHTGKPDRHEFYISDYTPYFEKIAKMFFESAVQLEQLNFWK